MLALNIKLWLYGGLAVALFGLILRFDYLSEKVDSQKIEIAQKNVQINETLKAERESLRIATENRTKYYLELESAENEIKALRARVDSGAARLRINATCKATAPATADRPSDNQAAPELTEDARQAYWDLRKEMTQCPAQLALAIKTLQDDRK